MNLVRFLRRWRSLGVLTLLSMAVALMPQRSFACALNDPSCFVHAPLYDQLASWARDLWMLNRSGLVIAHWLEDMRTWLIDSVMVNAFTALTEPVKFLFYVALVVAWFIFLISFMVQFVIDLRWVDLRRAARPILVAFVVFALGGQCIKQVEELRVVVGSLLQGIATDATQTFQAPPLSAADANDLPSDARSSESIYAQSTACGTPARSSQALYLNDYAARYLWSNADDIHCADAASFAQGFRTTYFPHDDISDESESQRREALQRASAGFTRQITGVVMVFAAIVEQLLHLLFALALALVWIALLLSLVFAVFLPTETLFSSQVKAILTILRTSWTASFVLGLGLSLVSIAAAAGSAMLLLVCGCALLALCIWQSKQALGMMTLAGESLNMTSGGAIEATGGMLKGWATTAAVVGAAVATGGGSAMVGAVGSTMLRRAGRSVGDNPLSQAAGRVLTNRVADKIDSHTQDARLTADADLSDAEAAWYERSYPVADGATIPLDAARSNARETPSTGTPDRTPDGVAPAAAPATSEHAQALRSQARDQRARVLDRQAERARQKRNFGKADQLRVQAAQLRGDTPRPARDEPESITSPDPDPLVLERALEQLHEAQDDPEAQRRILAETARAAQRQAQVVAVQRRARRNEQDADTPTAIQVIDPVQRDGSSVDAPRSETAAPADGLTRPMRRLFGLRPTPPALRVVDQEIAVLAAQISQLEADTPAAPTDDARAADVAQLAGLRQRLTAVQEQRAATRPTSPALLTEALTKQGAVAQEGPVAVARTADGLVVHGHPVTAVEPTADGNRALVTEGGTVTIAAADAATVLTLPVDQALRVPTIPSNQAAAAAAGTDVPATTSHPHAATGATVPLPRDAAAPAVPPVVLSDSTGTSTAPAAPAAPAAGTPTAPAAASRNTGDQPHVGAVAATTDVLPARPAPAANGTGTHHAPVIVGAAAAASVPVMDAAPGAAGAPSAGAPANVPTGSPQMVPAPVPAPVAPPVAAPVAHPVAAPVAHPVPVAPAVAPPVAQPVPAPVPAPVASSAPVTPAPAATEARRPAGQPTRAPRAAVLPVVPEVRSRPDQPVPTLPTDAAVVSQPAAAQPWKRHKKEMQDA